MEYFKTYYWFKMHSIPPLDKQLSDDEWNENCVFYWNRFKTLNDRLPKRVYRTFIDKSFHDAEMESFRITKTVRNNKEVTDLDLTINDSAGRWILTYSNIHTLTLKLSEESNCQSTWEWAYDELLDVDEKYLSHEIIFSTGSLIHVTFLDKMIKIKKVKEMH